MGYQRIDSPASVLSSTFVPHITAALRTNNTPAENTAALTAAATAALAAGKRIALPAGAYNFLGPWPIVAWDGMEVVGAGQRATTLTNTATDGSHAITVAGGNGAEDGKAHGALFASFAVKGNASSGDGFYISGAGGGTSTGPLRFAEVESSEHGLDGFTFMGYSDHTTLTSCTAMTNGRNGLSVGTAAAVASMCSEVTLVGGYYAYNTTSGVIAYGTGRTVNILGTEISQNLSYDLEVSSAAGGSQPVVTVIGAYFEHTTTHTHPFVRVGSSSINAVHFLGCVFSDFTTNGMSDMVEVRFHVDNLLFDSCHLNIKAGKAFLKEVGATRAIFRNVMPASGSAYLRRLPDNSLTNVVNGGPTAYRWTAGMAPGDSYFDTTLGQPIWWDGAGWVDATGTTA